MGNELPIRLNYPAAETIFAPATAAGRAAVAVMRISGPDARRAATLLAGGLPPPRVAQRRRLVDPQSGEQLDDGLVLWFPAPRSTTGEDVAELHLHGSRAVLAAVMQALARLGLRLAEPGEFTRRAFENGKLDLAQAEGVADLIEAETEQQRRQALAQLQGRLSEVRPLGVTEIFRAQRITRTQSKLHKVDLAALLEFQLQPCHCLR